MVWLEILLIIMATVCINIYRLNRAYANYIRYNKEAYLSILDLHEPTLSKIRFFGYACVVGALLVIFFGFP